MALLFSLLLVYTSEEVFEASHTLMLTVHLHSISYASGASLNLADNLFFAVLHCTDVT